MVYYGRNFKKVYLRFKLKVLFFMSVNVYNFFIYKKVIEVLKKEFDTVFVWFMEESKEYWCRYFF